MGVPPPRTDACPVATDPATQELLARARSLEFPTAYEPPPGDPLAHHAAGYAKVMCSAVFVTGLDADFAAENVGYFTAPYEIRSILGRPVIDHAAKAVHVTLPGGLTRTARYFGDQGCLTLPIGQGHLNFTPRKIDKRPCDPSAPWPMGDAPADEVQAAGLDRNRLGEAMDAAFDPPEQMTAAIVVTWKGRLIAERYGEGVTAASPLESWSMGKSLAATLMGILVRQGVYDLRQPAPIPQWRAPGDPRAQIRIADILRMSSGLRSRAPLDPDFDPGGPYPDHLYMYTGGIDAFGWAASRPLQWPPGAVGRYRNVDPVLIAQLTRLAVEARGEDYLSFPQRALFDAIGARSMVLEVDPFGNFLTQGYELASARDWARLGNLYLQDGVWMGERLLPEGWTKFVSTPAPAWVADGRPVYGGLFWINGDDRFPAPREAYYMAGAGGQTTLIVPSHDLVIVRQGHFSGAEPAREGFNRAVSLVLEAVRPA